MHASREKDISAEPVAALYEQQKVHHVETFPMLEDQMSAFTADFDRARADEVFEQGLSLPVLARNGPAGPVR